jgi:hypothetical protein
MCWIGPVIQKLSANAQELGGHPVICARDADGMALALPVKADGVVGK